VTHQQWAGPLPPPAALEEFSRVVPNGAERIFDAWEIESAHRRKMEERDLNWSIFEGLFGKALAAAFAGSCIVLAWYCASIGAVWLSAFFGGGVIGAVVWAFVKTNRPGPQKPTPPAKP